MTPLWLVMRFSDSSMSDIAALFHNRSNGFPWLWISVSATDFNGLRLPKNRFHDRPKTLIGHGAAGRCRVEAVGCGRWRAVGGRVRVWIYAARAWAAPVAAGSRGSGRGAGRP